MTKPYVYLLSCPDKPWWPISEHPGTLINDMQEVSLRVNYETLIRYCEGLNDWLLWIGIIEKVRGAAKIFKEVGWIDFKASTYDKMPCYFVDWSGIEFIWVNKRALMDRGIAPPVAPWKTGKKWRVDVFSWLKGM